jgi:hypothetical protein
MVAFVRDGIGIAGDAMSSLAVYYGKLGRQVDALELQLKVLEMRRRMLPEGHPLIGSSDVVRLSHGFISDASRRSRDEQFGSCTKRAWKAYGCLGAI